jgi:hypothetical protein
MTEIDAVAPPDDAVMIVSPLALVVARPAGERVSTETDEVRQIALVEMSCEVASAIRPVAVYCAVVPGATRAGPLIVSELVVS